MDVTGKAAIVTGGGTGVGRATTLALAKLGCHVLVNYSRSANEAEQTAAEARELGVQAFAHQADVSSDQQCRAMVAAAVAIFGRLDVLVNCAGTTEFVAAEDLDRVTEEMWDRIMGVNVKGPFQCARAAKEAMLASGGGCIVNVSSVAARIASGSSIPYCASKAALDNVTVALARVLAPQIRVNGVAPGFIAGRWLEQGLGSAYERVKQNFEQNMPLQKVCQPADVAAAILHFITGPDLITGQTLVIDGGMLIAPLGSAVRRK
jgi:3-oxoacyl-[acyl-carrier protein] reductase